ncbi:MAG: methyltransferase domain-containing protein, partial [Planctomycetota bacterium]
GVRGGGERSMTKVTTTTLPDDLGHFGPFGGKFVPEVLMTPLARLESVYRLADDDPAFHQRLAGLLRDFAGRPTPLYFAQRGFHVTALDYAKTGAGAIVGKARSLGLLERITALCHDVREPLPFEGQSFDACYSHMLFCIAMDTSEVERLSGEVLRVLKPGGLQVYTVRITEDPQYGTGTPRGENMYEIPGGFIVHFFDEETIRRLAKGCDVISLDRFDEGPLPKKLLRVTLRRR